MNNVEEFKLVYGQAIERLWSVLERNGVEPNRIAFLCSLALRLHAIGQLELLTEEPETICALLEKVANGLNALQVEYMNAQWEDAQAPLSALPRDAVDDQILGTICPNPLPRLA